MKATNVVKVLVAGLLASGLSCQTSDREPGPQVGAGPDTPESAAVVTERSRGATDQAGASGSPAAGEAAYGKYIFTGDANPTTRAGRGEPSLADAFRPAAWVYIDGQDGRFIESDGQPQLQWVIETPASASPTFRVAVFEPLTGVPRDFKCVLRTLESADGSEVHYGLAAKEGTFRIGKTYALLRPGEHFVVKNLSTGDVVRELAPLAPGRYALAAAVGAPDSGQRALAVTYFTVADGDER